MQAQKTRTGRPSKLTESTMEKLIEALRSGAYRIDACRAAGIHYNTLLAWERKGEAQKKGEFSEFLDALRRAEAEATVTNVGVITRAAQNGDWRAAAWFLEHKYPDRWARLDKRADQDQDGNFEVNVNFVPVRKTGETNFEQLKRDVIDALAPFPEARIALSEKLVQLANKVDDDSSKDRSSKK
jgi:hypothetical protein